MATSKVKDIRKAQWQKIAKAHSIEYTEKNTVRYLVEKVAEKVGVNDDIVKLDDIKQQVYDKLESLEFDFKKNAYKAKSKKEGSKKKTSKDSSKKKSTPKKKGASKKDKPDEPKEEKKEEKESQKSELTRKQHYINEATRLGVNFNPQQNASDILQLIQLFCKQNGKDFIPHSEDAEKFKAQEEEQKKNENMSDDDKLAKLQAECKALGVAYGSAHTASDLEQLINAVKASGQTPPPAPPKDQRNVAPANTGGIPQANPQTNKPQKPPVADEQPPMLGVNQEQGEQFNPATINEPTESDLEDLKIYRGAIMQVVNNHFRPLSKVELIQTLNQGNYPFDYRLNHNKDDKNKVEVFLKSKENEVRLPSEDKNTWITIGG